METPVENPTDDVDLSTNVFSTNSNWVGTQNATNPSNSTLLFIAVEYVKDDNTNFKYDSEPTFSPQTSSYSEFDQHVSPLDPNMGSTACYSPVYCDSVENNYNNSIVVLQDSVSPLMSSEICQNNSFVGGNTAQNFSHLSPSSSLEPLASPLSNDNNILRQVVANRYLQMVTPSGIEIDDSTSCQSPNSPTGNLSIDYNNGSSDSAPIMDKELQLVQFPVDGYQGLAMERNLKIDPDQVELLITDQNGISYGYVSQDFLVSRNPLPTLPEDEQQFNNVLNTLENHGLVLESNDDVNTPTAPLAISDGQMMLQDPLLESDLLLQAPVEIALEDNVLISNNVVMLKNNMPISGQTLSSTLGSDVDPLHSIDTEFPQNGEEKVKISEMKQEIDADSLDILQLRRSTRQNNKHNLDDNTQLSPVEIALEDNVLISNNVVMLKNNMPMSDQTLPSTLGSEVDPLHSIDAEFSQNDEEKVKVTEMKQEIDSETLDILQLRRSRRQNNKQNLDDDTQLLSRVQSICDKPVPPRARASLPGSYLAINKLQTSNDSEPEYGVFARKVIPKRTQFGPLEGILCEANEIRDDGLDKLKLLIESEKGTMHRLDISDENTSNWMRFVRPARTYAEQNLVLSQQGYSLYYTTTRPILPRQELQVGYSALYAAKRKLQTLQPSPEDESSWPCFECPAKFSSSDELQKHLNVHDDNKEEVIKPRVKKMGRFKRRAAVVCPFCSRSFLRRYSLNRHLLSHTNPAAFRERQVRRIQRSNFNAEQIDKNLDWKCDICYLNFPNASLLNIHELSHKIENNETITGMPLDTGSRCDNETRVLDWKCDICYLNFPNSSLLNLHELAHKNEASETITGLPSDLGSRCSEGEFLVQSGDVQCPECSKEFPKLKLLINHVADHGKRKKIEGEIIKSKKAHKCMMCYKSFATRERLQRHTLVHGSEETKPLKCDYCGKRFLNNSALACHLKTHKLDKNMFECPICKMSFDQILLLKDHVKVHCVDGQYTCPHCQKVFKEYSIIRKHIRAFHCDTKHGCQYCGKPFRTLDKLRLHLLKHSDHREFLCADCGKQFKRKDKLKEHMKRMHAVDREVRFPPPRPQKPNSVKKFMPKVQPTDYYRFIYKCHSCLLGFKRRGMLVNHLAKRHPDISPDSVPELNLPILKTTRDYYCQYCEKVYKSSSKRKAHILKNHPGAELPMSNRRKGGVPEIPGVPNPTFSQTVGSVTTNPHGCQWCHKQYASKAKLLQHQRKKHVDLLPSSQKFPRIVKMHPPSPGIPEDSKYVNSPDVPEAVVGTTGAPEGGTEISEEQMNDMNSSYINCEDTKVVGGLKQSYKLADDNLLTQAVEEFESQRSTNQYYRIVPMSSSHISLSQATEESADDPPEPSRLYRLLTTNGPFPPYPPR